MSVNFGYGGYGMTNGMNMMGNMQNINTMPAMSNQCNCNIYYHRGTTPYCLQTNVNPLPPQAFRTSWISKLFGKMFG